MGNALVEGIAEDFHGRGIVARAAEILPQAKADHGQLEAGPAGAPVLHRVIACRIGPIGHGQSPENLRFGRA
ncbi:hypothetical protein D3C72_2354550 [compost metagenome]